MMNIGTTRTLTVELKLEYGDSASRDDAAILKWIEACLNCNTNHVRVVAKPASALNVDASALATVIDCARTHIEDIKTGIEEGIYVASENQDLPALEEALASVLEAHSMCQNA